ncbi:hypothetical protein PINS_up011601 [Pythium insidiosum]|nr:hypothetical protein PINS_up011601 [Pythium insidiosum]
MASCVTNGPYKGIVVGVRNESTHLGSINAPTQGSLKEADVIGGVLGVRVVKCPSNTTNEVCAAQIMAASGCRSARLTLSQWGAWLGMCTVAPRRILQFSLAVGSTYAVGEQLLLKGTQVYVAVRELEAPDQDVLNIRDVSYAATLVNEGIGRQWIDVTVGTGPRIRWAHTEYAFDTDKYDRVVAQKTSEFINYGDALGGDRSIQMAMQMGRDSTALTRHMIVQGPIVVHDDAVGIVTLRSYQMPVVDSEGLRAGDINLFPIWGDLPVGDTLLSFDYGCVAFYDGARYANPFLWLTLCMMVATYMVRSLPVIVALYVNGDVYTARVLRFGGVESSASEVLLLAMVGSRRLIGSDSAASEMINQMNVFNHLSIAAVGAWLASEVIEILVHMILTGAHRNSLRGIVLLGVPAIVLIADGRTNHAILRSYSESLGVYGDLLCCLIGIALAVLITVWGCQAHKAADHEPSSCEDIPHLRELFTAILSLKCPYKAHSKEGTHGDAVVKRGFDSLGLRMSGFVGVALEPTNAFVHIEDLLLARVRNTQVECHVVTGNQVTVKRMRARQVSICALELQPNNPIY